MGKLTSATLVEHLFGANDFLTGRVQVAGSGLEAPARDPGPGTAPPGL